jgi:hypothetical protein
MRNQTLSLLFAGLCLAAVPALCDELQDWEIDINASFYAGDLGNTFADVPGLNVSGFSTATGLGTMTLTITAPGAYYVGGYFFDPAATPFYNEYGVENGTPSGLSWQIDVPATVNLSGNGNNGPDVITGDMENQALLDTNYIPGTTSNYLNGCSAGADCNYAVSMAQALSFSVAANTEEVITFAFTSTNPGGFSLETVQPVDGNNTAETDVFYQVTAVNEPLGAPPPPGVPEPMSLILLATIAAVLAIATSGFKRISSKEGSK